ncbi:hypothetical protein HYALB_00001915, partial [Hymenoscyphus albidus]
MRATSKPPPFLKQRSSTTFILATVALGLFTDLFLYGLVVPILPFILRDRLNTAPDSLQNLTSIILACYAGSLLLFSLPAGIICDRISSRRTPFFAGLLALAASTVLLAVGKTVWVLILSRALQGMSAAVVWTVGFVIVRETVGSERLGVAMGSIFSVMGLGGMIAPPVGGVVYEKFGNGAVFGLAVGVLGLDFLMRALMIERGAAEQYGVVYEDGGERDPEVSEVGGHARKTSLVTSIRSFSSIRTMTSTEQRQYQETPGRQVQNESSPLLPNININPELDPELKPYILPTPTPYHLPPFLYIELTSPRLWAANLATLFASTLLAIFDATTPLHAYHLFHLTSLHSGLLFIPMVLPYLFLGPLAGHLVDRFGPKPLSTLGFLWLSIPLFCLGLPHAGGLSEVLKYATILFFCGPGMTAISAPSLVEMSEVMQRYHAANPQLFGDVGPYARLFGVNSALYSAGLALGPVVAAGLGELVGYA